MIRRKRKSKSLQKTGQYFLYRHVRLDKKEPFYIGVGTKYKSTAHKSIYFRAFTRNARTELWTRTYNKTQTRVEILFECDDLKFIYGKEREFIKLHGRIDLGTGTLVNFTDGGPGVENAVYKPKPRKTKTKTKNETFVYDKNGNFISRYPYISFAALALGLSASYIYSLPSKNKSNARGFRFFKEFQGNKISPIDVEFQQYVKIDCYNQNNELIRGFESKKEATKSLHINTRKLQRALDSGRPIKINEMNKNGYVLRSDNKVYQDIKTAAYEAGYSATHLYRHIKCPAPSKINGYSYRYMKEEPKEVYLRYHSVSPNENV